MLLAFSYNITIDLEYFELLFILAIYIIQMCSLIFRFY